MDNVVENSKTIPKKSITAKQLAKSHLTKRKNPDWDNLDRGYRYLTLDMKLPHDLAVALMGNVVEESSGNHKVVLKNGGGRGLILWDERKAPSGRYELWGSIWASVAKPANVYDPTTDTVKNYWAPWSGLKGDKVRLKFIQAPIKEKARIYAESYLRPGKPRIADRLLSTMQLDSIYNPRIKDIIVKKSGGKVDKMLIGGPIYLSAEDIKNGANTLGSAFLKGLGAVGKFLNAGFTSPTYGTTGQVSYARNAKDAKRLREQSEASEQALGKAMTWISPLNYGVAVWNGHGLNAKKGEEEVASWAPAWQAVGRLGELYVGPKVVKGVKSAPKMVVNTAAKAGVKPAKAAVVAREIKQATKNAKLDNNSTVIPHEDLFDFWHGGLESDFDFGNLDVLRKASKQSKRNRNYAGFYMYSTPRLLGAFNYGFGEAHGIKLKPDAKKLKVNFNTERIEALELLNYRDQGYDYIEGKDVWGAPEYILLNKDAIQSTGFFDHSLGHNIHILRDRNIPKVDLFMNKLPSKTSLAFFERKPSKLTEAERAGATKLERNFKPKLHVANYPGYLLKGLMKGSLLEKQLSKNGTININQLNAYFNKASQIEKEVANKVLAEKFAGLKTIDYNLFKKAVLDELVTYNRNYNALSMIPTMTTEKMMAYGGDRLGIIKDFKDIPDGTGGLVTTWTLELPILFKQFTFETPKISIGNRKHYSGQPIGHTRTFTNQQEPLILHVMESQSDWAQKSLGLTKAEKTAIQNIDEQLKTGTPTGFSTLEELQVQKQAILDRASQRTLGISYLSLHLHDNYLQRQLQENLKYAAENGLTKMRYPTSETAAKIEGYTTKLQWYSPTGEKLDMRKLEFNPETGDFEYPKGSIMKNEYPIEHQTILKKYADFPKLFLKLYKGLNVRTVTDAKGNTWYEVDVPKGYLSREWLFKQGGKMNTLEFLKNGSGIHIKKKNRGKFTSYCGGKVTDECILKGKNSSNPAIRKRATFAANARKWKHLNGGLIFKGLEGLGNKFWNFLYKTGIGSKGDFKRMKLDLVDFGILLDNSSNPNQLIGGPTILPGTVNMSLYKNARNILNKPQFDEGFVNFVDKLSEGRIKPGLLVDKLSMIGPSPATYNYVDLNSEVVPKGFIKGLETTPSGKYPTVVEGLSKRSGKLANKKWLENSNPITNEAEAQAAKDWVEMMKNSSKKSKPIVSKNKPKPTLEPIKLKTDYTQSGTSFERAIEGKRYNIPKKGRVSITDKNARAMEASDARITNAGYTNIKKGLILLVEKNIDKYPKHEKEALDKQLLKLYRKGKSDAEINKVKREFYKYLANKYGYYKVGGILKAQEGTKFNFGLKVGNFLNSDWGKLIGTGIQSIGSAVNLNKLISSQAAASKAQNQMDFNLMQYLLAELARKDNNDRYMLWIEDYQSGKTLDNPSTIVARSWNLNLNNQLALNKELLKLQNKLIDMLASALKADNFGNAFGSIVSTGVGMLGNYLSNKNNKSKV